MEDPIQEYLETLLQKANLTHLPDDFRQRYLLKLRMLLEERIGAMALRYLPEDKHKELDKMLSEETPDAEKMHTMFRESIPDYDVKLQKLLKKFGEEFLQDTQKNL